MTTPKTIALDLIRSHIAAIAYQLAEAPMPDDQFRALVAELSTLGQAAKSLELLRDE